MYGASIGSKGVLLSTEMSNCIFLTFRAQWLLVQTKTCSCCSCKYLFDKSANSGVVRVVRNMVTDGLQKRHVLLQLAFCILLQKVTKWCKFARVWWVSGDGCVHKRHKDRKHKNWNPCCFPTWYAWHEMKSLCGKSNQTYWWPSSLNAILHYSLWSPVTAPLRLSVPFTSVSFCLQWMLMAVKGKISMLRINLLSLLCNSGLCMYLARRLLSARDWNED